MGVKRTRVCAHLGLWVTKPKPLEGLVSSSKPPDRQGNSLKWELQSCPAAFSCQGICSWGSWAWHLQSNETVIMMINRPSLFFYTLESSVARDPAHFCSSASRWLLFKCTFQAPHQRTWLRWAQKCPFWQTAQVLPITWFCKFRPCFKKLCS